ncbi:MAG TPA: glycosyltransferase family 4 protein [Thermoplasmata archaeon]
MRSGSPLRILVVVARDTLNPRAGGGDQHMALLAHELASKGHRVTLWSASSPGLLRLDRSGEVTVHRLAPSRLLAPVVWARFLTGSARGFDVVIEEVIGGERFPFLGPILSHRPCVGMWYQDNRPLFLASYGLVARRLATLLQTALLRLYRDRFLITPSETTRQWLISTGLAPNRVVVHNPKVIGSAEPASLLPFAGRRNRFVSIGKFQPLKRFEEAINVLDRLTEVVPDAELVLLGREDNAVYLTELRSRIAGSHFPAHISLILNALDSQKNDILASAKALSIHSPIEGFGWTIPEAGLRGVPVIANLGTPAEAIEEDTNGTRVPFGDVEAYTRILVRWMTDEPEWTRLSQGAIQVAHRFADPMLSPAVEALILRAAWSEFTPTPVQR